MAYDPFDSSILDKARECEVCEILQNTLGIENEVVVNNKIGTIVRGIHRSLNYCYIYDKYLLLRCILKLYFKLFCEGCEISDKIDKLNKFLSSYLRAMFYRLNDESYNGVSIESEEKFSDDFEFSLLIETLDKDDTKISEKEFVDLIESILNEYKNKPKHSL